MHPERSGGRSSTLLRSAQNAPAAQSKDAANQLGNRSKSDPPSLEDQTLLLRLIKF
jgi:hypothetical protein